jgi:hypothetical protein
LFIGGFVVADKFYHTALDQAQRALVVRIQCAQA